LIRKLSLGDGKREKREREREGKRNKGEVGSKSDRECVREVGGDLQRKKEGKVCRET
jgi:hypothetical protein